MTCTSIMQSLCAPASAMMSYAREAGRRTEARLSDVARQTRLRLLASRVEAPVSSPSIRGRSRPASFRYVFHAPCIMHRATPHRYPCKYMQLVLDSTYMVLSTLSVSIPPMPPMCGKFQQVPSGSLRFVLATASSFPPLFCAQARIWSCTTARKYSQHGSHALSWDRGNESPRRTHQKADSPLLARSAASQRR